MSTSLAEQLRRLRVPQTFSLVDSKQRASILFDPKDAATKNRQTIFDLGYSGLTDLISLNPAFFQFEQTLFNQSTITFQRSVESAEVNILLDKNIKKFLQHLSPFFMLEPAHKCLEWLIRRFNINQYNKNEFLALIMPYHETMVFVKCVQTLNVKNANDPWKWLQPIQKPGIPLSKTAILNRAASDPAFVKFVCKATTDALKELDNKAHLLQAQINFYCITIVGALEHCKEVTESFIGNILPSLLKGFASPVIDFTAAVFMITAQLVSKTVLSPKLLRALVTKICSVNHTKLQGDMLLLLILLYQNQMTVFNDFPEDVLIQFISNSWLTTTLAALAAQSVAISALCDSLVGSCLRRVQAKGEEWNACKIFLESLLKDVHFVGEEAKSFIRTTLDNYHRNEPVKPIKSNEVIEIDSDEDIIMLDEDAQNWYSGYLQRLERQYPKEFDYTIKETLQGKENVSEPRRKALRTVLAFRLQSTYSEDNVYIYENLYHHNATNRIEGVKFLVKNLENLNISEQSKNLLSDSLADRLNDDSPEVVYEVLKMPTKILGKMLSIKSFLDALVNILNKSHNYPDIWMKAVLSTIKHITNIEILRNGDNNYIFLALLPYLMPCTNEEMILVHEILSSKFAQVSPFLKCIAPAIEHQTDFRSVTTNVIKAMTNVNSLPSAENVLESIEIVRDTFFYKPINFSCFLLAIKSCYISGSDPKIGLDILKFIESFKDKFQFAYIPPKKGEWIFTIRNNKVPLDLYRSLLEMLAINSELSDLDDFTDEFSKSLEIFLKIYNILLTNAFTSRGGGKNDYSQSLQNVLDTLFPLPELKLKFFANFYITNRIPSNWISSALRIRTFKICNLLLDEGVVKENFIVDRTAFIKILIGLTSTLTVTRQCSLKTLELLAKCPGLDKNFAILAKKILQRSEEIIMDERQFPLILFTIISPKRSKVNESEIEQESATRCLSEFLALVTNENVDDYLKAQVLDIIKQINSSQILKKLLKNGLDIVEDVERSSESSNGDGVCLDIVKSKILKLILNRYEGDTLLLLMDEHRAWALLEKCLKLHRASVETNGKLESLACEVMDIFTEFNYEKLPSKLKEQLIRLVVNTLTFAGNYSLITAGNKLITKINLDCRYAVPILEEMKKTCSHSIVRRRVSKAIAPDVESLQSAEWNNGITLLELLQNKKKLTNYKILIPILFELLKKCLDFEEQSTLEYAKQLILSCLLHCCQKVSSESVKNDIQKIPDNVYRTDLVVQCIRATQNPQTHHHALLLLSHLALMLPQQVLHNMMDVFTFMGSSVVRHDDSFSFQIISNIIESVVPTLVKANSGNRPEKQEELVIPVLKVFVDIALDVPEHRRLPLYLKLLRTLGASQYLWMFHCLLFESHIVHDEKEKGNRLVKRFPVNVEECPKRIDIALQLTKTFGPTIALQTCINLFDYLPQLPMDKIEDEKKMEVDLTDTTLFNIDEHSAKQLRHYKYVILQFVSTLTSSAEFINAIALRNEEEMKELKPYYQNLIIKILSYIPVVTKAMDENADTNQAKFWKILLHHSYDVLDNAISLLSPDMLLVVVHGLLQHQLAAVRKKVIEILISKLQYKTDFFIDCQKDNLLQLLNPFNEIIDSILGKDKLMENASSNEIMFIQQIALIAIKLLSKIMALNHIEEFKVVLTKLTKILKKRSSISKIILATAVLAVTEVSSNLKAHSIAYLSKFVPHLVAVMQEQADSLLTQSPENVCLAIVTGVQKLYETLPLFLGPYNVDILTAFTLIWVRVLPYQEQEPRAAALISKLRFIWSKFASLIPLRVLIPNCCKSYKKLMLEKQYSGIRYLMNLLTECMENVTAKDIMEQQNELTTLFLQALEFRSDLADYEDQAEIVSSEEHILDAFVVHILKLSESNFRPLYHKVYDWAIRDSNSKDRVITYFLLSSRVAEALKSLFVLFASDFIQNAADLLDKCNGIKSEELYFSSCEEKNAVLIESILKTLYYVFLHDSKGFIDPHRFDILMQPLVDQLENPIVLQCEKRKELLVSCLSQLAVAVSSDSQWKQLNYQVLLKTRSNNPEHRILAFSCCVETVRKLGESFSPLLPETIPFVAELFEDENEDVEKSCRKGVHEMEKILGESLQSYF